MRAFLLILWCIQVRRFSLTAREYPLGDIYDSTLKTAKYVDLTHAFSPVLPVRPGFGEATFGPTVAGKTMPGYVEINPVWHSRLSVPFRLRPENFETTTPFQRILHTEDRIL